MSGRRFKVRRRRMTFPLPTLTRRGSAVNAKKPPSRGSLAFRPAQRCHYDGAGGARSALSLDRQLLCLFLALLQLLLGPVLLLRLFFALLDRGGTLAGRRRRHHWTWAAVLRTCASDTLILRLIAEAVAIGVRFEDRRDVLLVGLLCEQVGHPRWHIRVVQVVVDEAVVKH